jgi:hypothetical protein
MAPHLSQIAGHLFGYMNNSDRKIQENGQGRRINFRSILVINIGFWLFCLFVYALSKLLQHYGLTNFLHGEYRITEQLTKYFLLLTILIAIHSYVTQNLRKKIQLSISFLLLGLVMYLSESNMIAENMEPVFGIILFAYTFFLLVRNRKWIPLLFLFSGCIAISLGVLADIAHDIIKFGRAEFFGRILPEPISNFLGRCPEEPFDVIGAAFVCLSIINCAIESLITFFKSNKYASFGFLATAGMIAVGNSFLHYQYKPSQELTLFSFTLTIVGFLGLIIISRNINMKNTVIGLPTLERFSLFIFFFFVVIPAVFGVRNSIILSLILWLPTISFIGFFLYFDHPSRRRHT